MLFGAHADPSSSALRRSIRREQVHR
jgi:hypothetical protein